MRLFITALLCSVFLSSCASQKFYDKVEARGQIIGKPNIQWNTPKGFVFQQQQGQNFVFWRDNGDIIRPETMPTDGGSVPRALWWHKRYGP